MRPWWQQRYAREFPDDARENRDSDVVEGTAEFAGLLGVELGRLGCSASDRAAPWRGLRPWVRDLWDKRCWNNLDYELTVRDVEPYAIGSLAGLILDSRGVDWWARAAAGETPMEILAGEASPLADHDDAALAAPGERALHQEERGVRRRGPGLSRRRERPGEPPPGHPAFLGRRGHARGEGVCQFPRQGRASASS